MHLNFFWQKKQKLALGLIFMFLCIPAAYFGLMYLSNTQEQLVDSTAKEIKGKVITLKELTTDLFFDYHNMFSNTVRKALEFPEVITLNYTIRYLQIESKKMHEKKMLHYCIFDNADNKLIGSIEIREKNDVDPGQLGCWLNEKYWGHGRLQEALKLITKEYFRIHPEATSYIAHVRTWNKRSYHALKKFGLKEIAYYYDQGKPTRYILEYRK